jgi:hypothetical protein
MAFVYASLMAVAVAQVRPEARPQPIHKARPKPAPEASASTPESTTGSAPAAAQAPPGVINPPAPEAQVTEEVHYLAPEDAPRLGPAPRRYHPPDGFAGHDWGETRAKFERLPEQPLAVRAAWSRGMLRQPEIWCTEGGIGTSCNISYIMNAMALPYEGGGFHVLSEYKIPTQGFRFTETGVLLFPVIYQFCANWDSTRREVPKDFEQLNQFCGMRLLFDTESVSQLRKLPKDHVTQYELVLAELIAEFGKPSGFFKRGQVEIQTVSDDAVRELGAERRFSTWRWCPAADRALATSCKASIVLSIDPESGHGVVLFSTPALWAYAYAREHGAFKGDPLFAVMHARPPRHQMPAKESTAK